MSLQKLTTLADMLRYGPMDPRHSLKIWVGMLKALQGKHREGVFFGTLNPGAVLIDMRNNIVLVESPVDPDSPYSAPELQGGKPADELADVYSMGVMLHRMLAGSLEGVGKVPPSRVAEGVPRWIDATVLRCTMTQRSRRFLDLEELFASLVKLKRNIDALRGAGGPPRGL